MVRLSSHLRLCSYVVGSLCKLSQKSRRTFAGKWRQMSLQHKGTHHKYVPLTFTLLIRSYLKPEIWIDLGNEIEHVFLSSIIKHFSNSNNSLFHCCFQCSCQIYNTGIVHKYINSTKFLHSFLNSIIHSFFITDIHCTWKAFSTSIFNLKKKKQTKYFLDKYHTLQHWNL